MCRCTPEIRTPWCGKKGCEAPPQKEKPSVVPMPHNASEFEKIVSGLHKDFKMHVEFQKWKMQLARETYNEALKQDFTPEQALQFALQVGRNAT
ncbi:MAG: hypothetical protein GY941_19870 [Planctomycetes bacterium]|nr:hypothetical protein [Planctomycetota bacterium]